MVCLGCRVVLAGEDVVRGGIGRDDFGEEVVEDRGEGVGVVEVAGVSRAARDVGDKLVTNQASACW